MPMSVQIRRRADPEFLQRKRAFATRQMTDIRSEAVTTFDFELLAIC
jgi:hypothetical protein